MSCSKDDEPYLADTYLRNARYGDRENQNLDVYFASDGTESLHPVIIYVHGGGWKGGNKSDWGDWAVEAFRDLGYVSVSIGYRLVPSVYYPDNLRDVIDAINWVYNNIQRYGGDPHDMSLVGHSAGSHLVASVVCNQKYLKDADFDIHDIRLACLLDGGGYLAMQDAIYEDADVYDMVINALNNSMDNWTDFGPANSIENCEYLPYFVLCHCENYYRMKANREFEEKLKACGFSYSDYTIEKLVHNEILWNFPYYDNKYDVVSHFYQ